MNKIFILLLTALSINAEAQISVETTTILQKDKRPNIIIVLADDLDDIFTPQYFPEVLPIIDSLKKLGIDFTNSFTPMSICCPSRSATLTGTYAHQNGVYRNVSVNGGWEAFKHNEPYTIPAYLSKTGYRTTIIGKYLNGYGDKTEAIPPYGWTDGSVFTSYYYYTGYNYDMMFWDGGIPLNDTLWNVSNKNKKHFGKESEDYSTDVLLKEAISFINKTETKDDQPFFMYLCPTAPHFPLRAAPRYEKKADQLWINSFVPKRPNFCNDYGQLASSEENEIPLDKSSWLRKTWKKRVKHMDNGVIGYNQTFNGKMPSSIKSFLQADWYSRMGSLYALNDMLRELIDGLKANGEWDNTLLIFTSDNGYMLGSHAMLHKGNPYEESIRVPMVIAAGDSLHLKNPNKIQEWITNLDLMPTILELAGIKIPENIDGISMVPLLTSDSITNFRDRFVMEYLGPGMVRPELSYRPKLIMKKAPLYVLDHPTYNAIRMKVTITENGESKEQVFKYIEWQRNPKKKHLKFCDDFRSKDPVLLEKLASGNKKTLRLKRKSEEVECELYCLTNDPYEMDNLLYYQPDRYKVISLKLKTAMAEIIFKNAYK